MTNDTTAYRLRQQRRRMRLTQREVAERLHVSAMTISKYETCRLPPTQMLIELARLYGVSTDYLLGMTDAASEPSQAMWIDSRDREPSKDDGNCFGLVLVITTILDTPLRVVVVPWNWANPLNCNYWTWLPDLPEEYRPRLPSIGKTMQFRRMKQSL